MVLEILHRQRSEFAAAEPPGETQQQHRPVTMINQPHPKTRRHRPNISRGNPFLLDGRDTKPAAQTFHGFTHQHITNRIHRPIAGQFVGLADRRQPAPDR